jgi:hypothetical protein
VALMAASAVCALINNALEEQQFVGTPEAQQRQWLASPSAAAELAAAGLGQGDVAAAANAEFEAHVAAVEGSLDALMTSCFALLPRLGEVESMVRVLQCVSAAVELMGSRVRPHLASITDALPQVWTVISARAGEGTGALTRLHSALIATLAHLISKLGAAAMAEPRVAAVLLPMLRHSTNAAAPEAEPLLEDGLKLWMAVLRASAAVPPELVQLLAAAAPPLLRRGQDNAAVFQVAEAYALHGGADALAPVLQQLLAAAQGSLEAAAAAMLPRPGAAAGPAAPLETIQEAGAAASLLALLQRLQDGLPPALEPAVRAAAALAAADYGGGVMRLPARGAGLVEACLELIYRLSFRQPDALQALAGGDPGAAGRLVDRWVVLSSSRDVGELFIPALAAAGRARRHNAAVALCAVLFADAAPVLREPVRCAQALVLGLKAAREQRLFEADQQRLQEAGPPGAEDEADQLLLRRLALARGDPLRGVEAADAVRAAAGHVAAREGQERMLEWVGGVDHMYRAQMVALLAGRLGEAEEQAAIESMQHAALS